MISVYAPTFTRPEPEKNKLYDTFRSHIRKIANTDTLSILGDFNARVGVRDEAWQRELGPHGLQERNDDGNRGLNLCGEFDMTVASTLFQHNANGTWQRPRADETKTHE